MSTEATESGCPVLNYSPHELRPVGEWTNFFDSLREEAPVIKNTFAEGYYVFTRYEDILGAYQDPETFASDAVTVMEPNPAYRWIPHMLGGDEHMQWRRQLGPYFSPKAVARLTEKVRDHAARFVDDVVERGSCDVMADFAFRFPTTVFVELMGLPVEDLDRFMAWETDILQSPQGADPDEVVRRRLVAMNAVRDYFADVIEDRRVSPKDDLVSQALTFQVDGEPVSDADLLSYCQFMFMAGLDTVAAAIGYSLYHLATHPADRRRVVDEPAVIPSAIEEILRVYAFTIPARKVTKDTEVAGCPIARGSMVQLPIKAATRDEAAFENAQDMIIDRSPNNHIAFGAGPHRCLGSHLARLELRIALEEWHKRIPEYAIADGAAIGEVGRSSGLDKVPIVWLT